VLLAACFSVAQTQPRPAEPRIPCDFKGELVQDKHKPRWFTSEEMKQRATDKVEVAGILKNADVNAIVIASVIVGSDGRVACLDIINPKHPLVVREVDRAIRRWKFKPMKINGKPLPYVGWLQFQFCRIGCSEGKISRTLLE